MARTTAVVTFNFKMTDTLSPSQSSTFVSWDQALHCGKKEKKSVLAKRKSAEGKWVPLGSLRSPIFFLFDPVCCLFSTLQSLVPGYTFEELDDKMSAWL